MKAGRYQVVDGNAFQGHPTGTVFEERLERGRERRAIARGAIVLLERIEVSVPAERRLPRHGSFRLPPGIQPEPNHNEAPAGASLIEGSS